MVRDIFGVEDIMWIQWKEQESDSGIYPKSNGEGLYG